jgi:hypothetical protein
LELVIDVDAALFFSTLRLVTYSSGMKTSIIVIMCGDEVVVELSETK